MSYDAYDVINNEGLIEVAAIGEYNYSWFELKVFYQPKSRRFFWFDDSGCSCNGWGDYANSLGEFKDGDRNAALRAVDEFWPVVNDSTYGSSEEEYANAKAAIRNYKAPE